MADHLFWWILAAFSVCKLSASSLWTSQMYMGFEINCWILPANNSQPVDCSWTIQGKHLKFQILVTLISFDCSCEPEAHLQRWCKCRGTPWTVLGHDSSLTLMLPVSESAQKIFLFCKQVGDRDRKKWKKIILCLHLFSMNHKMCCSSNSPCQQTPISLMCLAISQKPVISYLMHFPSVTMTFLFLEIHYMSLLKQMQDQTHHQAASAARQHCSTQASGVKLAGYNRRM